MPRLGKWQDSLAAPGLGRSVLRMLAATVVRRLPPPLAVAGPARNRAQMAAQRPMRGEAQLAAALTQVALALGEGPRLAARSGQRVARLWHRRLLAGEQRPLSQTLGRGLPSPLLQPVLLRQVRVHLVCPHHWTVALGHADVAFLPAGRLFGLGCLAKLVRAACARRVLQEQAADDIVKVLLAAPVAAAWVRLSARHPCLALHQAGAAGSSMVNEAVAGPKQDVATLTEAVARLDGTGQ